MLRRLGVAGLERIVCTCLNRLGVAPRGGEPCGQWAPRDLQLDDAALVQLFACINAAVKARGQTVVLGKTMWRESASVREFCKALVENLE